MQLTVEQVIEMAPDPGSAAAARKLMLPGRWRELGRSPDVLWGCCIGTSPYQVKIDLAGWGYHCSCPSRKFPCKHVLALLLLVATSPISVGEEPLPEWVEVWREKRRQKQAARETNTSAEGSAASTNGSSPNGASGSSTATGSAPVDKKQAAAEKAKQKRIAQREARVNAGLENLDLWISDLIRNGIAAMETAPYSFWEQQAKRLVDAQAGGIASRLLLIGLLPRQTPDWPQRLLSELSMLKLLIQAWSRREHLPDEVQTDIRQLIGWTVDKEELKAQGESLVDQWVLLGQYVNQDERITSQRTWIVGRQSQRVGLVLQFAPSQMPFADTLVPGTEFACEAIFYPGAAKQRVRMLLEESVPESVVSRPPGFVSLEAFFEHNAALIARSPWINAFGGCLQDVRIGHVDGRWYLQDQQQQTLPLLGDDHWRLLALSGGNECDLVVEWDGYRAKALAVWADENYQLL